MESGTSFEMLQLRKMLQSTRNRNNASGSILDGMSVLYQTKGILKQMKIGLSNIKINNGYKMIK